MTAPRRILLTGAGGFLGRQVLAALARDRRRRIWSTQSDGALRIALELDTPGAAGALARAIRPAAIVHAAACPDLGRCERDPAAARRINTDATSELVAAAAALGARFVFFSTDQVHDGRRAPYADDAAPAPLHVYGRTKAAAEEAVRAHADHVILRVALCYGDSPSGRRSASEMVLRAVEEGRPLPLFTDEIRTPVAARYVAEATARLLDHGFTGTLNLGGREHLSRHAFGLAVCRAYGREPIGMHAVRAAGLRLDPPRPRDLSLATARAHAIAGCTPGPVAQELAQLARAATRPRGA